MKLTPKKFDEWRIVPRLLVMLYGLFCFYVGQWFMALPTPSMEQTTFATAIWAAASVWFGFYVNSGNKKYSEDKQNDES